MAEEEVSEKLNERQEKFCQLYATDKEFFGNGVESYVAVYNVNKAKPNWYQIACISASKLLSKSKVYNRVNELLTETGFNDVAVDKQLSMLIHQHSDLKTKLGAIGEYNKLKARIIAKVDHTSGGKPISILGGITQSHAVPGNVSVKKNPRLTQKA